MFKDITMNNYQLEFELQWSYFLKDCLHEEISFELEERPVKWPAGQGYKEEKVIIFCKNKISNFIKDNKSFFIKYPILNDL